MAASAVLAACAVLSTSAVAAAGQASVSMSVTGRAITRPIAPGFEGLALEYSGIQGWVGSGTQPPNPVLAALIRNLDPVGRPVIRVGGLSTDHSWWPVPGMREPLGITYTLTPGWAQSLLSLARTVDARLVLGVNLEADSPRLAQAEADAFLTAFGRRYITALDIGNEPPLYSGMPWYRTQGRRVIPWYDAVGAQVFGRSLSWGPSAFAADYARILSVLPHVPIAGPDTQREEWFAAYERFLSAHSRVRMLVSHGYGLNNCVTNPASAAYPSIPHLLGDYALHDLLNTLMPYVHAAHADGASFRIDEMGSVTCNGRPGVSDTMASALWSAAALFSVAQDGIDGVNLHTYSGLSNGLFDFTHGAGGWTADVHPIYYGALLFARAAPAGSRLLHVSLSGPPTLHGWATTGPGAVRHVVLLNDSTTAGAAVVVRAPHGVLGVRTAQLARLSAPSVSATAGVSLGGRSFGAVTTSGLLRPPVNDPVRARRGAFHVAVPAASAAVLTFTAR
jgi:Glycosyl hydrolase family 79 C-terminal beta domain